jgi:hypothetical protein
MATRIAKIGLRKSMYFIANVLFLRKSHSETIYSDFISKFIKLVIWSFIQSQVGMTSSRKKHKIWSVDSSKKLQQQSVSKEGHKRYSKTRMKNSKGIAMQSSLVKGHLGKS